MDFETRLFNCADLQSILDCVLDGGLELTGANLGNVKLVDQRQRYLTIAAQRGFHQEFLDFFHRANADDRLSICGRALRERRTIISDVISDVEFARWRSVAERAGFRSLQSTPIISSSGTLLGIISTHFPIPHEPTEREMNAVRSHAKLAANTIARMRIRRDSKWIWQDLKTCKRCGGRSERVTTIPKSSENVGYDLYQCLNCKLIEWHPLGQ